MFQILGTLHTLEGLFFFLVQQSEGFGYSDQEDIPGSMCQVAVLAEDAGTGNPKSVVQKECMDTFSFLKTDGSAITVFLMR